MKGKGDEREEERGADTGTEKEKVNPESWQEERKSRV